MAFTEEKELYGPLKKFFEDHRDSLLTELVGPHKHARVFGFIPGTDNNLFNTVESLDLKNFLSYPGMVTQEFGKSAFPDVYAVFEYDEPASAFPALPLICAVEAKLKFASDKLQDAAVQAMTYQRVCDFVWIAFPASTQNAALEEKAKRWGLDRGIGLLFVQDNGVVEQAGPPKRNANRDALYYESVLFKLRLASRLTDAAKNTPQGGPLSSGQLRAALVGCFEADVASLHLLSADHQMSLLKAIRKLFNP